MLQPAGSDGLYPVMDVYVTGKLYQVHAIA